MKLDPIVISAIKDVCNKENVSHAEKAVIRFLERYISNELPVSQRASSLQAIYELFGKGEI